MKSIQIKGLDELDIMHAINSKKNFYLKLVLADLERECDPDTYKEVRKIVLDSFNEFSRSILRVFTGDVER